MIAPLFLSCALALPSIIPGMAIHGNIETSPPWDFDKAEVHMIKELRDWRNVPRPGSSVLIYGPHPQWVNRLNNAGIKTIGMWHRNERWPYYLVGEPIKTPFKAGQFQVYIYDDFPVMRPMADTFHWMFEISRIVVPEGIFLDRKTLNGRVEVLLRWQGWQKLFFEFHDFRVWKKGRWKGGIVMLENSA